jgi:hypothetical protein
LPSVPPERLLTLATPGEAVAGRSCTASHVARSAIVLAIGVGGGLATMLLGYVARPTSERPGVPAS